MIVAPPTPERLHARALRYLERYATTAAHLRRVLLRRAAREAEALGLDTARVRADVDAVIARVVAAGLVDDRQFALGRARRLAESGRSPARIRAALAGKKHSSDRVERMRAARWSKPYRHSPETRAKMSASSKGIKQHQNQIAALRRAHVGAKRTPEQCANISAGIRAARARRLGQAV